jgi:hypothetical protein
MFPDPDPDLDPDPWIGWRSLRFKRLKRDGGGGGGGASPSPEPFLELACPIGEMSDVRDFPPDRHHWKALCRLTERPRSSLLFYLFGFV